MREHILKLREADPSAISDEDLAANYGSLLEQLSGSPLADPMAGHL